METNPTEIKVQIQMDTYKNTIAALCGEAKN